MNVMIPGMDLRSAIRASTKAVRKECRKRRWRHEDDVRQDVVTKVWLMIESGEVVSKSVIYCMVKSVVANSMRCELKRARAKAVFLSDSEWEAIEAKPKGGGNVAAILDEIEDKLEPDELVLFRHLRNGHSTDMIAKAMGMNVCTIRRDINRMLEKARSVWDSHERE